MMSSNFRAQRGGVRDATKEKPGSDVIEHKSLN